MHIFLTDSPVKFRIYLSARASTIKTVPNQETLSFNSFSIFLQNNFEFYNTIHEELNTKNILKDLKFSSKTDIYTFYSEYFKGVEIFFPQKKHLPQMKIGNFKFKTKQFREF